MYKIFPKAIITNFYGPTEFTINATYFQISKKNFIKHEIMPIGNLLPGVKMKIITKKNNNIGELLLSGKQIMTGYVNHKSPIRYIKSKSYYPTGDYVNLDKKGLLHYVSRKNDYQKISGYRIDVIGIEKKLSNFIKKDVLLFNENSKLFLFIFSENKISQKNKITLENFINKKLEEYEKPKNIIYLKNKPINTSGKIDTNKLREFINE